ncbi:MAG: 1-acyl-sn-glycerol-3-phosphate acyltransferase [Bacteroidota bacterium]
MQSFFINLHLFIAKHKTAFIFVFILLLLGVGISISNLKVKEDLTALIPKDKRVDKVSGVLNNSKFADRIIFNISYKDTSITNPDELIVTGQKLTEALSTNKTLIKNITYSIQNDDFMNIYNFIYDNLPLYLDDNDYAALKKRFAPDSIDQSLSNNFKNLIAPTGLASKQFIFKDPLNILPPILKKLENFQLDKNFGVYNSYIFTKNQKNHLIFLDPTFSANNIQENKKLIQLIDSVTAATNSDTSKIKIEYYGGTAVAVANASRIKKDIFITVSITFIAFSFFFFYFFRRIRTIFLLFFPVVLGTAMSIAIISIFYGELSAIVLGIGSVLVGMAVDYTVYAVTYYKSNGSVIKTIKDISVPLIMGSISTILSFLCLYLVHSEALWQLGMFAALSITLTVIIIMTILPFFLEGKKKGKEQFIEKRTFFDTIAEYPFEKNKILVSVIIALTIIFLFTSKNVGFNGDLSSLNYLSDELSTAEKNLKSISSESSSAVYIITQDSSVDQALNKTEELNSVFKKFIDKGVISTMSSASDLVISKDKQKNKIEKWNSFWKEVNANTIKNLLIEKGKDHHFKDSSFVQFYSLINKDFSPKPIDSFAVLRKTFLSNYIHKTDSLYSIVSILKVERDKKNELFKEIEKNKNVIIFDKQYYANQFFDIIKEDFDILVFVSSILVFGILLLSFGRMEIALITFVPIILSWIWTVGLMGLFGIEFNIFNIIITTFIFGCGDDYAIYVMSGLLDDHKYGNKTLVPYKQSVLLSALTIICSIGVLIFAKHPALQSIALVSIFGLTSVVIISYTILPALFLFLVKYKEKKLSTPVTLTNIIISLTSFIIFLGGSILLTIIIPTLFILPIRKKAKKHAFSYFIYLFSRFVVFVNFKIKKIHIDKEKFDLSKPAVIISNHQSHLDLVLILMLHPKIIVLTNKWVWNNPFYGLVVKYADFFPIYKGLESGFEKIKNKVENGYSILVFPEGKRTADGEINRFHQGAFQLADNLGIDMQPIIIHGAYQSLPKTEIFLKSGQITLKFFDKIKVESTQIGDEITYKNQTKAVTAFYRSEFNLLRKTQETPKFFSREIFGQYLYKGPVLEWYMKIKVKQENYYDFFNSIIPLNAKITDIGCGYGFLTYMLHVASKDRTVLGIDYDEEKISIAKNIAIDKANLNFKHQDISIEPLEESDVFILNDVLHYLPENNQFEVLKQCMNKLSKNGFIILRDADADLIKRTKITKFTEFQSTRLFKFNKTKNELFFISGKKIADLALENGFTCTRYDHAKYTSNITFILKN